MPEWPGDYYFDKQLNPIGLWDWVALKSIPDYYRVDETYLIDRDNRDRIIRVSTVWIGINMAYVFRPRSIPLVFETMVFTTYESETDEWQDRYHSEKSAQVGHNAVVLMLSALVKNVLLIESKDPWDSNRTLAGRGAHSLRTSSERQTC